MPFLSVLLSVLDRRTGAALPCPCYYRPLRNLGPLLTIVLSYRKCSSLLTPSIHWVSCVRLPRPVFIFFCFFVCIHPKGFFLLQPKHTKERMALSELLGEQMHLISKGIHCMSSWRTISLVLPVFQHSVKFPTLYWVCGKEFFLRLYQKNFNQFQIKQSIQQTLSLTDKLVTLWEKAKGKTLKHSLQSNYCTAWSFVFPPLL